MGGNNCSLLNLSLGRSGTCGKLKNNNKHVAKKNFKKKSFHCVCMNISYFTSRVYSRQYNFEAVKVEKSQNNSKSVF